MDPNVVNLLFSVGFVIVGSIVFSIATLISGYSIYRELEAVESSFLSIAAGIIIILYSPIVFIVLSVEDINSEVDLFLNQLLNINVIISFFSCAIGLGLICGYLTTLNARDYVLSWFREKSGIKFWIQSYGLAWDEMLARTKKGGEISVETKSLGTLRGTLEMSSIRKEPRQIVLGHLNGLDGRMLILEDEIKSITIPERSFKKHFEKMNHVGQAFNCVVVSIGFFLLAYSADMTCDYYGQNLDNLINYDTSINISYKNNDQKNVLELEQYNGETVEYYTKYNVKLALKSWPAWCDKEDIGLVLSNWDSIVGTHTFKLDDIPSNNEKSIIIFYNWSRLLFLIFSIIFLIFSVWLAEKDFQSWISYLKIVPEFLFIYFILSSMFICLLFWDGVHILKYAGNSIIFIFLGDWHLKTSILAILGVSLFSILSLTTNLADEYQKKITIMLNKATNRMLKYKKYIDYTKNVRLELIFIFILLLMLIILEYKPHQLLWISEEFIIFFYLEEWLYRTFICILLIITSSICLNSIIKKRHREPFDKIIDDIANDKKRNALVRIIFNEPNSKKRVYEYLYAIIQNMYFSLRLNGESKSRIEDLDDEAIKTFDRIAEIYIAIGIRDELTSKIKNLKTNFTYMENEDINILLILTKILKERINEINRKAT